MAEAQKPKSPEPVALGHPPMGEEMDTARWTLPPLATVGIALGVLAIAIAAVLWYVRPKPQSAGGIEQVGAVQTSETNVLVAVQVRVENSGAKPLWVRNVKAQLATAEGEWSDEASSAVDHERYFQAYPELRKHAIEPLLPETRIESGQQRRGLLIFGFPVAKQAFDARQRFTVTIEPYDRPAVVLAESPPPGG